MPAIEKIWEKLKGEVSDKDERIRADFKYRNAKATGSLEGNRIIHGSILAQNDCFFFFQVGFDSNELVYFLGAIWAC